VFEIPLCSIAHIPLRWLTTFGSWKTLAGVAISMVSARDGSAYALVLDAKTLWEDARAKFPYAMPY
jgi:hypothetical protein